MPVAVCQFMMYLQVGPHSGRQKLWVERLCTDQELPKVDRPNLEWPGESRARVRQNDLPGARKYTSEHERAAGPYRPRTLAK
eukprot:8522589-Pyramimonas_sp.AAC.1